MKKFSQKLVYFFVLLLISNQSFAQEFQSAQFYTETEAGGYAEKITSLAANSSCSRYSWKKRGRAPAGYVKGVALSFARSVCRAKMNPPSVLARIMGAANIGNTKRDALAHYQSIFHAQGIGTTVAGENAVRATYALGMGLGMRESSGKYCEGWDVSAGSNRPSATAEAGLFQVSYDSMGASPELRNLYNEYQASPERCHLQVFKQGVSCKPQSILGTGAGAQYQVFNKACPAFATEYAMTMLRLRRSHFGPINRREAEVIPSCDSLLKNVQLLIERDPETACEELF